MATLKLKMSLRGKSGEGMINILVSHQSQRTMLSTGLRVPGAEWDATRRRLTGRSARSRMVNIRLSEIENASEKLLLELTTTRLMKSVTFDYLVRRVRRDVLGDGDGDRHFMAHFRKVAAEKRSGTAGVYTHTARLLERLYPDIDCYTFDDITPEFLRDLDARMEPTHSASYRSITLRNIRAVMNHAIDSELTTNYPFRRFKIGKVTTRKRSLTVYQLRLLKDFPCEEHARKYRDVFMLIFTLCGINLVDLCRLRELTAGRADYSRAKTGNFLSIRVEPEAMELINRHRGKGQLLDIMDRYANHKDYMHRMNDTLKLIGITDYGKRGQKTHHPQFPGITSYWARHTWATLCAELDVPDAVIGQGLGHSESGTTSIYIWRNGNKVDQANRRLLDWVWHGKREGHADEEPGTASFYGLTPEEYSAIFKTP